MTCARSDRVLKMPKLAAINVARKADKRKSGALQTGRGLTSVGSSDGELARANIRVVARRDTIVPVAIRNRQVYRCSGNRRPGAFKRGLLLVDGNSGLRGLNLRKL